MLVRRKVEKGSQKSRKITGKFIEDKLMDKELKGVIWSRRKVILRNFQMKILSWKTRKLIREKDKVMPENDK